MKLAFGSDGLAIIAPPTATPDTVRFAAGADITLTVASTDARPHGLTVEGAPQRVRVVLRPGEEKSVVLRGLPTGTYLLAPDGAADPLKLVVTP